MITATLQSLDIVKEILIINPEIKSVRLILHDVALNWGQKYDTSEKITSHFEEALIQETPLEVRTYSRGDFLSLEPSDLLAGKHQVWSFTSKVLMEDGSSKHVPMMNFHPLEGASYEDILSFIELSEPKKKGVILSSGRYFHYYGYELLTEKEWLRFNARFLMPMILVRSRYVGHRVRDGYSTLRLTCDTLYKPKVPEFIQYINA